jgi:hypothetical protein
MKIFLQMTNSVMIWDVEATEDHKTDLLKLIKL